MKVLNAVLALAGLALTSLAAVAETTEPIRIIVPLGTGTLSAAVSRELPPRLTEADLVAWSRTPEDLRARIDTEVTKWTKLAREANIQPE